MINSFLKKKNNTIEKFRDEKDILISYEDLKKIPINKVIPINVNNPKAIECTRLTSNNDNSLMFTVTMKKGEVWEKHYHNCLESILVFRGKLKDCMLKENNLVTPGKILKINPYNSHYIKAEEDSIFYVEFKNPE